jgi:hypothetical protein
MITTCVCIGLYNLLEPGPCTFVKIEENNNQYLQLCIYIVGQSETTLTLVPITTMKTTNELFQSDPIF